MHVRLIAVGDRQPSWVDDGYSEYQDRLPRHWQYRLHELPISPRTSAGGNAAMEAESRKVLDKLRPGEYVVLLDERGKSITSREFGSRLADWQAEGRDLCFVIGGPDGVSDDLRNRADFVMSLSVMTLPHGLARVLFAEQLYRAWSLTQGHPYHRD